MALATDDPNDPSAQLRRRITTQLTTNSADPVSFNPTDPTYAPPPQKPTVTTQPVSFNPTDPTYTPPPQKPIPSPQPVGFTPTDPTYTAPPQKPVKGIGPTGFDTPTFNAVGETPEAPADPTQTAPAAPATTTPAAPTAGPGGIPTNPDGSQVGSGTPWSTGPDAHPLYAPPGYHWDSNLAMFQPGQDTNRPTGGHLTDPGFASSLVAWAATQPGVNPSVKNDPQYWIQKFQSGAFGDDQNYALQRMMQAEGAPEGGGAAATPMPAATSAFTDQVRKLLMDRMGRDTATVNENDSYIAQPFAAANLQAQREQEMERKSLAEHAAATGDTSGSVNMGIQQSAERNAVGLGSLKASLIQKEYASRRADLSDAMNAALASGDRETATQLQMALAQLDAQLRREGYGVNLSEFEQQQNNHTVGAV